MCSFDEIVEAVAKAMCSANDSAWLAVNWDDHNEDGRNAYRAMARAALEEIRVALPGGTALGEYVEKRYPFSVLCCGAFSDGIVYVRNMLTDPSKDNGGKS